MKSFSALPLLTPTGHWPDRNRAAQQYRGYAIPFVQAREVLSSETTRFLHASWRRGRSRPIAEITALILACGDVDSWAPSSAREQGADIPLYFRTFLQLDVSEGR